MTKKRALVTGITGQDGSYLAELLLEKGYTVYGLARRESWYRPNSASHLAAQIEILFGDVTEEEDVVRAVQAAQADEIYSLASQSRPGESWSQAAKTLMVDGMAAIRLFEAVRHNMPSARLYHASSSEMFGHSTDERQNELTAFNPLNPYAASKVYAHNMARIYRENYGLHICIGILFNHESERRPLNFLSQKVTYGAACASLGIKDSPDLNERGRPIVEGGKLTLGNLGVSRDWGYAPDFVRAIWMIMQERQPADFAIGTGISRTVRDFCEVAYGSVGCDWNEHVVSDPMFARPLEHGKTVANPETANQVLGWKPSVSFEEMVERMVRAHVDRLKHLA